MCKTSDHISHAAGDHGADAVCYDGSNSRASCRISPSPSISPVRCCRPCRMPRGATRDARGSGAAQHGPSETAHRHLDKGRCTYPKDTYPKDTYPTCTSAFCEAGDEMTKVKTIAAKLLPGGVVRCVGGEREAMAKGRVRRLPPENRSGNESCKRGTPSGRDESVTPLHNACTARKAGCSARKDILLTHWRTKKRLHAQRAC